MTSETNPETATTTYVYDSDATCGASSGDLVKRVDAVGNTTCYAYDALHRVTSITYYSGPYAASTPNKYFVYDSATVNSVAMANAKGRLAEAYTATCPTCAKITDVGISYTVRGQLSDVYQSTPHSGGYYHVNATYWAHGALDQLSGLPGLPTLTYTPDGEGRPAIVSASTGQNPVLSTTYNVASQPTQVNLGSSDSDSTLQKAFVPLPAGAAAVYNASGLSYYRHPDWLGSSRFASTPTGTMYSDVAYAPFGEPYAQAGTTDLSFTGQNQDTVGGSYDFLFREYATQGRWPSPDPAGLAAVDLSDPRSLNRYAYVLNAPVNLVDLLGLDGCAGQDPNRCVEVTASPLPPSPLALLWAAICPGGFGMPSCLAGPRIEQEWRQVSREIRQEQRQEQKGDKPSQSKPAGKPVPPPCRIVDPFLAALEFTGKLGPELQFGPVKAGFSLYKNITTGDTGGKAELNAGLFHAQADNPTPMGGSLGGGSEGNQYSASFLGFQYNFTTASLKFSPSKSFTLGLQALVGGEVSFNSDTLNQVSTANAACRAQGGG